jgi:hypothetical protein
MNKIILLSLLAIALFASDLEAQTACNQYKGDYNLIRNALIERAKAADLYKPTASAQENRIKGWSDVSINFLAEKWVAICRCNEGVTKEVFDNEIYGRKSDNSLLINASPPDDRYFYNNQQGMKDLSIFKDLTPPNRIYISSDCVKGQSNNPDITHTDCWNHPDYKVDPKDDPQGYIKTFKMAECMCKGGVQTQEEAETLYRQMLDAYNSYKTYYPNSKIVLNKPSGPEICSKMVMDANGNPVITTQPQVNLVYTGYESNAEKFRDEYIKTFSTNNEFNAYASGMNVKRVGEALAKDLSNNLKQIQGLVNTTDPLVLLQDFNQKITQIESLEANFNEQYNSYSFQTGQQLGNSISNKDYESAMFQGLGLLNASLERKEAQKQMEAQKQALYEERRSQMSKIYWKAVDYNNAMKQNYIKRAAFSEKLDDEKFNLAFVENLDCHNASMKNNFSVSNTAWLENKCAIPRKTDVLNTFPKGTSKDVYYLNLAEHKFKQFEKLGHVEFQEAAIHFTAQAITIKPTAERFVTLAKYYKGYSDIYELSNYLTAQSYNKNILNNEQLERVEWLKLAVEQQVKNAIFNSDQDFINAFLQVGFDDLFKINDLDILDYSIKYDQYNLLPTLINAKNKKLDAKSQSQLLQRSILLCITYDSHNSLQSLIDAGVSLDFKLKNKAPIDLIFETQALRCLTTYLRHSNTYEEVSHFYKGLSIVKKNNLYGVINGKAEEVIKIEYSWLRPPAEGLIVGQKFNPGVGLFYGAIGLDGKIKIPFSYEYLGNCVNDRLIAKQGGKYGYISSTGEIVVPFKYNYAQNFGETYSIVGIQKKSNGPMKYGVINREGTELTKFIYDEARVVNSSFVSLAPSGNHLVKELGENKNKSLLIEESNDNFTIVSNKKMNDIYYKDSIIFSYDPSKYKAEIEYDLVKFSSIKSQKEWFLIDKNGRKLDLPSNLAYRNTANGLIAYSHYYHITTLNGKCFNTTWDGFMTKDGATVQIDDINSLKRNEVKGGVLESIEYTPFYLDNIDNHLSSDIIKIGIAESETGTESIKWGYIDNKGNWIIPPQFKEESDFSEDFSIVSINDKDGIIDRNGKLLVNDSYLKHYNKGILESKNPLGYFDLMQRFKSLESIFEGYKYYDVKFINGVFHGEKKYNDGPTSWRWYYMK